MRVLNARVRRGPISHALFDFDGTVSLLRRGWEHVMQSFMESAIRAETDADIEPWIQRIADYIDESTGILTIYQMRWLTELLVRLRPGYRPASAHEYKRRYNQRMLDRVRVHVGEVGPEGVGDRLVLEGVPEFLAELDTRGIELYLASGTDDEYVQKEAALLGVREYFHGRVYGARDDTEEYTKENIIRRILSEELGGPAEKLLVVFGDGPVEVMAAKEFGAVAVGVASDEDRGSGWNQRKVDRLTKAGADILIPDFSVGNDVLEYLTVCR